MLKNLLISKVRIKLLEQLFFNPKEQYHVRGLVRILDEEINAIRRELLNLEDAGLLRSQKMNNKVLYILNPQSIIFEDLRNLVLKNSSFGKRISKISKDSGKIQSVLMTSAFLNKEYESDSDIDFLFIGEVDIQKLSKNMKELEQELGRELRYTAMTAMDFDFGKKKRDPIILNVTSKDFVTILGSLKTLIS